MILASTTDIIRLVTSAAVTTHVYASWADLSHSGSNYDVDPAPSRTVISTATTTTVVAAPASSVQRKVLLFSVRNVGSAAQVVTVETFDGTTAVQAFKATLAAGQTVVYQDGAGWALFNASGAQIVTGAEEQPPSAARLIKYFKVGAASEAAGLFHSDHAATGFPGAWAPGTPGLNGRATDGMAVADAGCIPLWTPTGSLYLTGGTTQSSLAANFGLYDVLWINSGTVVTTTTAQAITSVAFPARDLDGAVNGRGCSAGILVTTATTNAGAVTNTTLNYTNSAGTAGRTGTMASFPATAIAGTVVWFQLAAGDEGVRSIEGVTLGTSYGGGAISLIVARPHLTIPAPVANLPFASLPVQSRLYTGSCLLPINQKSNTTAMTYFATVSVEERA